MYQPDEFIEKTREESSEENDWFWTFIIW
jgi:hypothetical protein